MLGLDPRILSRLKVIEECSEAASRHKNCRDELFEDHLIRIQNNLDEIKSFIGCGCPFKLGDAVVFEPANFNLDYWNGLTEKDRVKYYGPLGYGAEKKKVFVFLGEINQTPGHCILISLDDQKIETMRHISDFRLVTDEEL